jgi:hypothetical protein
MATLPTKSIASSQSVPPPEDLSVLFLPLTPGNSMLCIVLLLIPVRASGDPFVASFIGSEPSHGVALDPVGSISLAYCYVSMTLLQFVSAYRSTLLYRPPINSNSNALPLSALLTVLRCRPLPIHRVGRYSSWLVIFILEPPSLRAHKQCDGTARHHPVGSCCQRAQWLPAAALQFIVSHRGPLVFRTPVSTLL